MGETIASLTQKIEELKTAEQAREARDIAQDAVTAAQITALQTTIDELRAIIGSGGLSPADQAALNTAAITVQATIDSLNAADPTAPIIVPVVPAP